MNFSTRNYLSALSLSFLIGLGPVAHAQETPPPGSDPPPIIPSDTPADPVDPYAGTAYDGDYLTLGAGPAYGPSYEGSDDYILFPLAAAVGRLGGVEFQPRGAGLAFDMIPDVDGARLGFLAGPVITLRLDRNSRIKDAAVAALGERDIAVEVGGTAGVALYRLASAYDSLTAQVDVRWDVAGAHGGMVIAPMLTYFTPVSQGAAITVSASAEHVDDDYADYYFDIGPVGAAASGLPQFDAEGGWKNVGVDLLVAIDLDGNLANGGFAVFAGGGYARLLEDAKRSPVTSIRGDADQWLGAVGVGYTF